MKTNVNYLFAAGTKLAETAAVCGILCAGTLALFSTPAAAQTVQPFFPLPPSVVSTIPSNGDVNPYGVAFVPNDVKSDGVLQPGDILVSNFNNAGNVQGMGSTITRISERGVTSTFFQGKSPLGLSAALGVLRTGLVFVGSLPTLDGTSATVQPGALLLIDRRGNLIGTVKDTNLVNGPWGMAIDDDGNTAKVFFSNILSGTITRLDLVISPDGDSVSVKNAVRVGAGFNHRPDPAAIVLGPSGLFYDSRHDVLFVASSLDNAVYAIQDAGSRTNANDQTGNIIYQDNVHLHGPIDLVMAPNGHFIVANSDGSNVDPNQPSELVEFTADGKFVSQFSVDPNNGGAFGIGLKSIGGGAAIRFAAVDDNTSSLTMWTVAVK